MTVTVTLTPPKPAPAPRRTARPSVRRRPNLVVFDLETTGFSPDRHEIIQIAAARLDAGGSIGDTFFTHVRPHDPVPPHITALTGIRNADVAAAPAAPEALRALARFVEDAAPAAADDDDGETGGPMLVAHNGHRFDLRFIAAACARHALPVRPVRFIDSLWLSRALWPAEPLHNLDVITARLGLSAADLPHARHDARADVRLLAAAVQRILHRLRSAVPPVAPEGEARYHDFVAA